MLGRAVMGSARGTSAGLGFRRFEVLPGGGGLRG